MIPVAFIEKLILSSPDLQFQFYLKSSFHECEVYFWVFYSDPLAYFSIHILIPHLITFIALK